MNGYPIKFWHGDWFAAKGLGVCQIEINGVDVTVYTSHYHAEYDPNNDIYLGHRVIHALESAQWLNLTSGATDLTLYCGDFNTEPATVPYRLLRGIVPLNDAWAEHSGDVWGGETSEITENSFTGAGGKGKRIDYIMYRAGPGIEAETTNCWLPLANRVPDESYSYSDHEAVAAIIKVTKPETEKIQSGPEFRRSLSVNNRSEVVRAVKDAVDIIDKSLKTVDSDQTKYVMYSFTILVLLVLSFIPTAFIPPFYYIGFDLAMFIPRFVLTVFFVIFVLMASLYNKKERNALISTKKELQFIISQDVVNLD
jgi:sphingomyelin phosphodiesterase 2